MEQSKQILYTFEGFRLDPSRRLLFGPEGQPVPLPPRAFDALLYLVERPGELNERRALLEAIWPHVVVQENNLDQAISTVRRALGEKRKERRFIMTEPGRGYRFVARVETIPAEDAQGPTRADTATRVPAADQSTSARREAGLKLPLALTGARLRSKRVRLWGCAAATVAVAVVAGVAASIGTRGPMSEPPALRAHPLSSEKGGQRSPVWSPDGSAIAFAARSTANEPFQLHLRTMDSPIARPIPLATNAVVKQWTTAGKILFVNDRGLWSVLPAGGEPPELIERFNIPGYVLADARMDVMRDGSAVAMLRRGADGAFGVWTARIPGAELERYEPAPFAAPHIVNAPFLRFSPDGAQLLLMWNALEGEQAWLMPYPPDASRPPRRVLEGLPAVGGTPQFSWLPDSRHIVVSTAAEARRELYIADTKSGRFRLLSSGPSDQLMPVVSPGGDSLVFTNVRVDADVVTLDIGTTDVAPLVATGRMEQMPAWAADVESLVYVTDRSGWPEIWLHQRGRLDRPVVTARDFAGDTQWFIAPALSPDGTRVIYHRVEGPDAGSSHLWMSRISGGPPQRVTNENTRIEAAGSWSPDGAWYVYTTPGMSAQQRTLKKVRTTGQAEPEVLLPNVLVGSALGAALVPVWSPDGEWILIADQGMKLVSPDGEASRDLGIEDAACAFARTEKLLYCISTPLQDGGYPFIAIDFEGNVERVIGTVARENAPFSSLNPGIRLSPTPDGSGVSYAAVGGRSEDLWVAEGLAAVDLP